MADRSIDFRSKFTKVVSDATINTYISYAKCYKDWAIEQNLNLEQKRSLKNWSIDKTGYYIPECLCNDLLFSLFLSFSFEDAKKKKLTVYPHVRKIHGFLAHSLKRNNLVPFRGAKDATPSSYPETETIWQSMQRSAEFCHYNPARENKFLSLQETNLVRKREFDMNDIAEVQKQLIFTLNIMGSCRPESMKRLNSLYCNSWDVKQDGCNRKRAECSCVITKTNQGGMPTLQADKDQSYRLSCCCPVGDHDPENSACPVTVFDVHKRNIDESNEELKKDLKILEEKLKKQNKRPNKSEKEIQKTKKKIKKIKDILDPMTHTPLIRTIQFGKKRNCAPEKVGKPIGFQPIKATSAYKWTREMISKTLKRNFVFYDGRKTQCNAVKNQLPKLGLKVDDQTIAKYATHNSVVTLNKHYITNKNEDKKFECSEAFSLLQCAAEKGFDEDASNSLFLQRKRQLEIIDKPVPKRICTSRRSLTFETCANSRDNPSSENSDADLLLTQPPITKAEIQNEEQALTQTYVTNNNQLTQININSPVQISQAVARKESHDPLGLLLQHNISLQNNFFKSQQNQQKMNAAFMPEQFEFQREMMKMLKSRFTK